jgi:hypothetical protein
MFTALSILSISILTQILKKNIMPKYGPTGVHILIAIIALVFVSIKAYASINPGINTILVQAGQLLVATIGIYEILIRKVTDNLS